MAKAKEKTEPTETTVEASSEVEKTEPGEAKSVRGKRQWIARHGATETTVEASSEEEAKAACLAYWGIISTPFPVTVAPLE
jgi:hypothetical protein